MRRLARMGSRYSLIRVHKGVRCPRFTCIQIVTSVTVAYEAVSSHNVPVVVLCVRELLMFPLNELILMVLHMTSSVQ